MTDGYSIAIDDVGGARSGGDIPHRETQVGIHGLRESSTNNGRSRAPRCAVTARLKCQMMMVLNAIPFVGKTILTNYMQTES